MKKKLIKLLGMLVILCMLFTAVGCASASADDDDEDTRKEDDKNKNDDDRDDEDKDTGIVGTWEADIDMAKLMNEMLGEELGVPTEFEDLAVTIRLKINRNDTYELSMDEDSVEDMYDDFLDQFKDVMKALVEEAAGQYEMTFDEFIAESGYDSFDAFFEEAASDMDKEDLVDSFDLGEEGAWKYEDDKLWLGEGDDIDEDTYYVIELKGKTMTWKEATGEEEEMSEYLLPLKFRKK